MRAFAAIDFNLEGFLKGSYQNAIAHFMDEHVIFGDRCPDGMANPLLAPSRAPTPVSTVDDEKVGSAMPPPVVAFQKDDPAAARATERTVLLSGKAE